MANLNMSSIMSKVRNFTNSKEGKEKIDRILKEYRKNGISKTEAGSEVLTYTRMSELAQELISTLKMTAASHNLPRSVMNHFNSLDYMMQDLGDNKFECYIYFNDDLSRESLDSGEYQGDGINNIVALFNNGYVASDHVYGWWDGHKPTGESIMHSMTGDESYAFVRSKIGRPSLRFMQRSIQDFYSKYSKQYTMNIILNDDYDGDYSISSSSATRT